MIIRWLKKLFGRMPVVADKEGGEKTRTFWYKYMDYPFGDWQYFEVTAEDQDAADIIAISKFQELFDSGCTVMKDFYRANNKNQG